MPAVTLRNLAVLDAATSGWIMEAVKVHLLAVGAGPALDYADATAFLAEFEGIIERAKRRKLN